MIKFKIITLVVVFLTLEAMAYKPFFKNNILEEYFFDYNNDDFLDKIIIYKQLNYTNDFEQEHFDLQIKIFEGISTNEFVLRYENNLLIPSPNQNCFSEGYSHIDVNSNKFTIISQTCYDYIFVTISFEFKIQKDGIYLYKYSEDYFDKSDHDRKIKPKILTRKKFGKLRFENVNLNTFLKYSR